MNFNKYNYTNPQLVALLLLRFAIGWHLLYEGIVKITDPSWTSLGFLKESKWILSGFSEWVIQNDGILYFVDILNAWGLIAIGIGLILGLFSRIASLAGVFLLMLYYLTAPPLTGLEYSITSDGNNLIINKTLIEAIGLVVLYYFPTGGVFGIDLLLNMRKRTQLKGQIDD